MFNSGLNYKKDARQIRESSARIIRRIIEAYDHRPHKNGPLFVVMGGVHAAAAHLLVELLILQELKRLGYNIAFGKEMSLGFLCEAFKEYAGCSDKSYIEKADDKLVLTAWLASGWINQSRHAHRALFNYLQDEGINVGFNDLERDNPLAEKIAMRNAEIVKRSTRHAAKLGVDIYMQECGGAHIGDFSKLMRIVLRILAFIFSRNEDLAKEIMDIAPYEEGLAKKFENAKKNVFDVLLRGHPVQNLIFSKEVRRSNDSMRDIIRSPHFFYEREEEEAVSEREVSWLKGVFPYLSLSEELLEDRKDRCYLQMIEGFDRLLQAQPD